MLTCRRLALAILVSSATAATAQPAVPAVPPLRSTRPAAAQAAPKPATQTASKPVAAPVVDPDAPPTSDAAPAGAPVAAASPSAAQAAAMAADAPPTSDAAPTGTAAGAPATAVASATPNPAMPASNPKAPAPNTTAATAAQPAVPPTVTKNYPLTPEGNARFLAEYAARPDVKKLDGGVLYRVLKAADAKDPKSIGPIARNDTVTVSYRGWLIDGKIFDQTKPDVPIQFALNGVVSGWRTALMKMKVGDLWEVAIPADQAYGAEGRAGRIPPNQALIFVISLAKVEYAG